MKKILILALLFTNSIYPQSNLDVNAYEMLELVEELIEHYRTDIRTPSQILVNDKKTLDVLKVYELSRSVLNEMDEYRDGVSLIFKKLTKGNQYVLDPKRLFPFIALEESVGILNRTLSINNLKPISILNLHRESFFTIEQADFVRKESIKSSFKQGQAKKPFISKLLLRSLIEVNILAPAMMTMGAGNAAIIMSFVLPFMSHLDSWTRFGPLGIVSLVNLAYYAVKSLSNDGKELLDMYKMQSTYKLLRKRGLLDQKITPQALKEMGIHVEASTTGGYFKFGTGYKIEINNTDAKFFISASENGDLHLDYSDTHKDIKRFGKLADITATTTFMAKPFSKALAEIRENEILKSRAFEHLAGCNSLFKK